MKDLNEQERAAIEAVAGRFSATWKTGSDTADAYIVLDGKRVAVEVRTLKRRGAGQGNAAPPHLRFDKVVSRVMERLQAGVGETVPDGMTVLLTMTAPIRLPSQSAAALEAKIKDLLKRGSSGRDGEATIHGNRVLIRFMKNESDRTPKLIGFVHNSDSGPLQLLNMTSALIETISLKAGRFSGDRWLVLVSAEGNSYLKVYRQIYSQLRMPTGFRKILMVFNQARVGMLTD